MPKRKFDEIDNYAFFVGDHTDTVTIITKNAKIYNHICDLQAKTSSFIEQLSNDIEELEKRIENLSLNIYQERILNQQYYIN